MNDSHPPEAPRPEPSYERFDPLEPPEARPAATHKRRSACCVDEARRQASVGSLDAAWRDAVAALPELWSLSITRFPSHHGPYSVFVVAKPPGDSAGWSATGSTEVEALRALTAKLRDRA